MLQPKTILSFGAILAFLSVALGAFGAHALKDFLQAQNRLDTFETAVRYQMYHALALIFTGILAHLFPQYSFSKIAYLFLGGIFIFSGSLYILCASGQKWLGAVTPLGGLCFLLAWVWLAWTFFRSE
jgi:uncharacterized membrane protein YgdD (TMEM256/DUF423 family)